MESNTWESSGALLRIHQILFRTQLVKLSIEQSIGLRIVATANRFTQLAQPSILFAGDFLRQGVQRKL